SVGQKDERRAIYNRFDSVLSSGWGILITASGGYYGEMGEVVDVDNGSASHHLNPSDAVLKESRVLLLVPPCGETGLIIAETRGRSHLTANVLQQLRTGLTSLGITVRVNSEFADEYAWSRFLDTEEINVRSVELVQNTRSSDRTNFTEENVKRTTLKIDLEDGTEAKRRITGAIR